jgi:nickel/cobalt exporter
MSPFSIPPDLLVLLATAASIGLLHTLAGPDHYLPFVVMSRARSWSVSRTLLITLACGLGHVLSSVVLGVVGIAAGGVLVRLQWLESLRGDLAAWLLISFGFAYMIWGLRRAVRDRPHVHIHAHVDGDVHAHVHSHDSAHGHPHDRGEGRSLTPWVLFTVFVLGPCEPLIPILMYPAAKQSVRGLVLVTLTFGIATIATMIAIVWLGVKGVALIPLRSLERYSHALAGLAIAATGLAVAFLGL